MKEIFGAIVGLLILFYAVYTPIYFIADTPEDLVEDLTLNDVLELIDDEEVVKGTNNRSSLIKLKNKIASDTDLDHDDSLVDLLEDNQYISDVTVKVVDTTDYVNTMTREYLYTIEQVRVEAKHEKFSTPITVEFKVKAKNFKKAEFSKVSSIFVDDLFYALRMREFTLSELAIENLKAPSEKTIEKSIKILEESIEHGDFLAYPLLAAIYSGTGFDEKTRSLYVSHKNMPKLNDLIQKLGNQAQEGNLESQMALLVLAYTPELDEALFDQDLIKKAEKEIKLQADKGDSKAQFYYGTLLVSHAAFSTLEDNSMEVGKKMIANAEKNGISAKSLRVEQYAKENDSSWF